MRDEDHSALARMLLVTRGVTVVAHITADARLVAWSQRHGVYVRIDRRTLWGNPFRIGVHGDRDEVCARYDAWLRGGALPPACDIRALRGRVLGCWCYPARCHGDTLARYANALIGG